MALLYVLPNKTEDGDGSLWRPFQISQVTDANVNSGDELVFAPGVAPAYPHPIALSGKSGLLVRSGPGYYTHDTLTRFEGGWTNVGGATPNVWTRDSGGATFTLNAFEGWTFNPEGLRNGNLQLVQSIAEVDETPGSLYVAATGEMYVHRANGQDPNDTTIFVQIVASSPAFRFTDCPDLTLMGIGVAGRGIGHTGIVIEGANLGTIRIVDTLCHDCIVGGSGGAFEIRPTGTPPTIELLGCQFFGGDGRVLIAPGNNEDIANVTVTRCRWVAQELRNALNEPVPSTQMAECLTLLPSGTGNITNLLVDGCDFSVTGPNTTQTPIRAWITPPPGDFLEPTSYPVRFVDTRIRASAYTFNAAGATSYDRCILDFTKAVDIGSHAVIEVGNGNKHDVLFHASLLALKRAEGAPLAQYEAFGISGNSRLGGVNTDFYLASPTLETTTPDDRFFHLKGANAGSVELHGCLVSRETVGPLYSEQDGGLANVSQAIVEDTAFVRIDPDNVSPLPGLQTEAELLARDSGGGSLAEQASLTENPARALQFGRTAKGVGLPVPDAKPWTAMLGQDGRIHDGSYGGLGQPRRIYNETTTSTPKPSIVPVTIRS